MRRQWSPADNSSWRTIPMWPYRHVLSTFIFHNTILPEIWILLAILSMKKTPTKCEKKNKVEKPPFQSKLHLPGVGVKVQCLVKRLVRSPRSQKEIKETPVSLVHTSTSVTLWLRENTTVPLSLRSTFYPVTKNRAAMFIGAQYKETQRRYWR